MTNSNREADSQRETSRQVGSVRITRCEDCQYKDEREEEFHREPLSGSHTGTQCGAAQRAELVPGSHGI